MLIRPDDDSFSSWFTWLFDGLNPRIDYFLMVAVGLLLWLGAIGLGNAPDAEDYEPHITKPMGAMMAIGGAVFLYWRW